MVLFAPCVFAEDWDPFTSLNQVQSPVDNEEFNDSGFVDTRWQVNVKDTNKGYLITLILAEEDLPSKVIVDVSQGQLRFTLGPKVYYVPVKSDALIDKWVVKVDGEKIKVTIPRRKLYSII